MIPIALQLYTLRDLTQKDFTGTLKQVANIGYSGVEFAGYGSMKALELKKLLTDLNLKPAGSHVSVDTLVKDLDAVIDYNLGIENEFIICPWQKYEKKEDFLEFAKTLNDVGERCKKHGLHLCYHNHAHEFVKVDDHYGLDLLFENTKSDLVGFEIDTYWVKYAGEDPVKYIKRFGMRTPLLHIKDMEKVGRDFTEIGNGTMNIKGIVSAAKSTGVKWLIIEQDKCKIDPLESAKISFENLRKINI